MSSQGDRRPRLYHTVPELDMTRCLGPPEGWLFPYRFPACPCHWQRPGAAQASVTALPWARTTPWCLQMGRSEASRLGTVCWRQMYRTESLHGSQEQPTRHSVSRRNSWKVHHPRKLKRAKQCLPSSGLQVPDTVLITMAWTSGKQLQTPVQWYLYSPFLSWTWLSLFYLRHTEHLLCYLFFSIFSCCINLDINDEEIDVGKQSKSQREFMLHKMFHTKFRRIFSSGEL